MQCKYHDTEGMPVERAVPINAKKIIINNESDPRNIQLFSDWSNNNLELSKSNKFASVVIKS